MPTNEPRAVDADMTRFAVYLDKEQFQALERLQELCGHETLEQTIRAALRLYDVHLEQEPNDHE
jgi:hypothetical protein